MAAQSNTVEAKGFGALIADRLWVYAAFGKLRLASLVVFSASISYLLAPQAFNLAAFLALIFGGFLVTAASNGYNQILERDLDKLMDRTKERPLPAGKMSVIEGVIVASLFAISGLFLLWYFLNPLSVILGTLAIFLYVVIYTPMKRISPIAVLVGAFPGAIPPMLGYVAATGEFGLIPGILFAVQFVWQFPHFWAIAWRLHEDYRKAGFSLLPTTRGRDRSSAFQMMLYSFFLIPTAMLPWYFGISSWISLLICVPASIYFAWIGLKFFRSQTMDEAKRLMFASFFWLPLVQISFLL
jgi:protoheme IX farnesyltransferase